MLYHGIHAAYRDVASWPQDLQRQFFAPARPVELATNAALEIDAACGVGATFVLEGCLRVFLRREGNREITLYEVHEGELCGLNILAILAGTGLSCNVQALAPCRLLLIPGDHFVHHVNTNETIRHFVFRAMRDNYDQLLGLLDDVVFSRLRHRLENYLVEKSENGQLRATHQKIARDLGTAREVITRLLRGMEREGCIELRDRIIDISGLLGGGQG